MNGIMSINRIALLGFITFMVGCATGKSSQPSICEQYNWHEVVHMASPYMSEFDYVNMVVMQGPSSEYDTSMLVDNLDISNFPKDVQAELLQVKNANCHFSAD